MDLKTALAGFTVLTGGVFWADRIIHDRASLLETQRGHLKRYIYLAST